MSIKNVKIRFNLEKENDRRAYDYLQNAEKSYSKAVISAICGFMELSEKAANENAFLERIIATIKEEVAKNNPLGGLLQLVQIPPAQAPAEKGSDKVHNKKRKNAEHNMFSGLLVCSDCGSNLHFHFNQGNESIQYFNCSNNNSRNRTCPTTHYIRADFLEELVRTDINRLIAFTNQYKDEFLRILEQSSGAESQSKLKSAENEIERLLKRNEEIDKLFSAIYEDKIKGTISEERFEKMSKGYEKEQTDNKAKIFSLSEEIKSDAKQVDTTKMFLDIVDKTTHIEKLTAEIVREFIDKIVVHHRIKKDGITTQKVEINYNVIGKFELPPLYNFDLSENETQSITY